MPTRRTRRPSTVSTASTISQTLQHVSDDQYTLTIPDARHGSLQIRLKLKSGADTTVKIGGAPINCYAFACERRRNIPGGTSGPVSMPWMVKPDTIHEGLLKDGAIPLGLDPYNSNKRPDITVAPDQEYYLIAAMFHTEEFHFARLFNDGWWAKPSKVGLAEQMTSTITPVAKPPSRERSAGRSPEEKAFTQLVITSSRHEPTPPAAHRTDEQWSGRQYKRRVKGRPKRPVPKILRG